MNQLLIANKQKSYYKQGNCLTSLTKIKRNSTLVGTKPLHSKNKIKMLSLKTEGNP